MITAKTAYGIVRGVALEEGCTVFRGIPYAQAERFMPPAPPEKWEGELMCDTFSPICYQPAHTPGMPFSDFFIKEFYPHEEPMSEDSLALNIWTSAKEPGEKQPVMVWFHGGDMGSGYGHEMEFDGKGIAKRGVILVTLNYRLGFFGYFAHPEFSKRIPGGVGGNNAIRDQQAALRWVQENIEAFGGDPARVTIFGQSAGGGSVISHLCSPLSEGLFSGAIIQSGFGGITSYGTLTMAEEEDWGERFCLQTGKTVDKLLAMPADQLQKLYEENERELGSIPKQTMDGIVFPTSPAAEILTGSPKNVHLMVGSVTGDGGMYRPGEDPVTARLKTLYGNRAGEFEEKYPQDDQKNQGIYRALMDSDPWFENLYFCINQTTRENPAYLYHFCPTIPGHDEYGFVPDEQAYHSAELWYVFGTLDRCWRDFDERYYALSDMVMDYWTNFAKNGNSNGPTVPEWHPYSRLDQDQLYATNFLDENGSSIRPLINDDVWALVAFRLFAD